MAQPKSKVVFRYGTRAEYDALQTKDAKSLYFLLDTHELYRGDIPIGIAHYYEGVIDPDLDTAANILNVLDGNAPVTNDLLVLIDNDTRTQDLYVYTIDNEWKCLNARTRSTSVIFSDGKTLDEKLADVQASFDINEKVFEFRQDVLSLKDYQKRYHKFVPEVAAQGNPGDPDYVEAVPSHYELVTVDAEHPWPAGLTPRVEADGSLGWYEPNAYTLEGIGNLVDQLQTDVGKIDDLENRVTNLETTVGTMGTEPRFDPVNGDMIDPGSESTGLIKRVEDLEKMSFEAGIKAVKVNDMPVIPDATGTVNIRPFAGNNAGVVPPLDTTVRSLSAAEKKFYHMDANGQWSNVIGDLTFERQYYPTVSQYVDARVEDSTLRWEEINN